VTIRRRYTFRGIIQGVGFRPAVYRVAVALGLVGFVRNQRSEVVAELEGSHGQVGRFAEALERALPSAARIDSLQTQEIPPIHESSFRIVESRPDAFRFPPIPPDLAICAQCAAELFDPSDRRYLYPFITCTQCGPRYSIVERTPFDRDTTSMVDFDQCPLCLKEYTDPADRRFHSQTNSCPACGPRLRLTDQAGSPLAGDPAAEAVAALKDGRILAVQGIGGFHLAADPRNAEAVRRLRRDKERERKPFALMVADLEEAGRLCLLGAAERELLSSPSAPILILPAAAGVPEHLRGVSHTGTLGIMLPYTPLHLLLFRHPGSQIPYRHLIMTSGNLKDEPIITDPAEARRKLAGIADLFLAHDRRILFRTDDSILRLSDGRHPVLLRRSRGYVPGLLHLRQPVRHIILALGGDLKNAPALARADDVYLAPFIGDLEDPVTQGDFERQVRRMLELYGVKPEVLVHDLHPGYHSTRWAAGFPVERKVGVQHHHGHLLSVMAEHGLGEAIGLAFDGTGYGTDGTIWGGEFLWADRTSFRRLGSFLPFPLPGGEAAVLRPLRIVVGLLAGQLGEEDLARLAGAGAPTLLEMTRKKLNSPLTSSLGRLFDAAAALLGLVERVSYEGEGPIRMEGLALAEPGAGESLERHRRELEGGFTLSKDPEPDGLFHLDLRPLLLELAGARLGGVLDAPGSGALRFHRTVALAALEGARELRRSTGMNRLALSGGVFQNMLLNNLLLPALIGDGFQVYTHRQLPPGDGGLAVGQVYFQPDF
jgi:hydrogenase maturation protein HypF